MAIRLDSERTRCSKSGSVVIEVCTLDRRQGREAAFVFISLVRNRATNFLDAPKWWNVAVTRPIERLFLWDAGLTVVRRRPSSPSEFSPETDG